MAELTRQLSSVPSPATPSISLQPTQPKIQPLTLTEKKALYTFWMLQYHNLRHSPSSQSRSERTLRRKLDGNIPKLIQGYLIKGWNKFFAGRYVYGEPERRVERSVNDLRVLTKRWRWLCRIMGFVSWPDAVDGQLELTKEVLEHWSIEVSSEPFGIGLPWTPPVRSDGGNKEAGTSGAVAATMVTTTAHSNAVPRARSLLSVVSTYSQHINMNSDINNARPSQQPPKIKAENSNEYTFDYALIDAALAHHNAIQAYCEQHLTMQLGLNVTPTDPTFNQHVLALMAQLVDRLEEQEQLSDRMARMVRAFMIQWR